VSWEDTGDFLEHRAERRRWCTRERMAGPARGGERGRLVLGRVGRQHGRLPKPTAPLQSSTRMATLETASRREDAMVKGATGARLRGLPQREEESGGIGDGEATAAGGDGAGTRQGYREELGEDKEKQLEGEDELEEGRVQRRQEKHRRRRRLLHRMLRGGQRKIQNRDIFEVLQLARRELIVTVNYKSYAQ